MIEINLLAFILFAVVLAGFLLKDRKNIRREGIVFIRRTFRGVRFIDKVAKKWPRFWRVLSIIGVVVAVGAMIFASYFIVSAAGRVAGGDGGGVKLVLPGPVDNAVSAPAVLLMPWYFWIIGILALTIPHEFAHGIVARLQKLKVKTVGWFFLVIIPGAFVEPDEKALKASSASTKLKVYSAGSFANFIMALLFFVVMLFYIPATLNTVGLTPGFLEADMPMAEANATGAILSINNVSITSIDALSVMMASIPVNTTVNVETITGNYTIQTVAHEQRNGSRLGVLGPYYEYREIKPALAGTLAEPVVFFFGQLFDWIILLNLGVGLVNLLPVKPLDGGFIMETIVERFSGRKKKRTAIIVRLISFAFLLVLLYSVFGALL